MATAAELAQNFKTVYNISMIAEYSTVIVEMMKGGYAVAGILAATGASTVVAPAIMSTLPGLAILKALSDEVNPIISFMFSLLRIEIAIDEADEIDYSLDNLDYMGRSMLMQGFNFFSDLLILVSCFYLADSCNLLNYLGLMATTSTFPGSIYLRFAILASMQFLHFVPALIEACRLMNDPKLSNEQKANISKVFYEAFPKAVSAALAFSGWVMLAADSSKIIGWGLVALSGLAYLYQPAKRTAIRFFDNSKEVKKIDADEFRLHNGYYRISDLS